MWTDGVLELAEAIKKYYDELNLPPVVSFGCLKTLGLLFSLVLEYIFIVKTFC